MDEKQILEKKTEEELEEKKEGADENAKDVSVALGETSTPNETEPVAPVPELNNTPVPEQATEEVVEEVNSDSTPTPKMFTQDEVNNLMGQVRAETRDRTFKYIYGRYGVEDENGLDDLIGNAQRYDTLKENTDAERNSWDEERKGFLAERDSRSSELVELKERLALLESGIDKDRYEDAKFILKGKGLEITPETIANELATHPEWKKGEEKKTYTPEEPAKPEIKVPEVPNILGNEGSGMKAPEKSEEDVAMEKYFKIK
jgi:flagellar motility protein MotE (MotC chaperone)